MLSTPVETIKQFETLPAPMEREMSNIPEAREELEDVCQELTEIISRVESIIEKMRRAKPVRAKAGPRSRPVDQKLAQKIREYAKAYPDASYMGIANEFGTNIGRVSEAIHGKR